jgi:hypothetical protein
MWKDWNLYLRERLRLDPPLRITRKAVKAEKEDSIPSMNLLKLSDSLNGETEKTIPILIYQ